MRHISLKEYADDLPPEWQAKSEELLADLVAEPDCEKRKALIEKNRPHWGALADWLREISYNKCWYTEAPFDADYPEVDHYRPKKACLDKEGNKIHEGYWWLAFEWTNYRLSKPVPNRQKGAYFPLRRNDRAATCPDDPVDDEYPLLLDPTSAYDCLLLSFADDGRPIAVEHAADWDKERVDYSISRYKLDYDPINQGRKATWTTALALANEWIKYQREASKTGSAVKKALANEKVGQLKKLLSKKEPYSMVAMSSLQATGNPAIQKLAMAAAQG